MRGLIRNAMAVARRPALLPKYLNYQRKRIVGGAEGPLLRLGWGDSIGGFVDFSEYLNAGNNLSPAEARAISRLAGLIEEGNPARPVILDVGANLGLTALCFARSFVRPRIVAFEPGPTTVKALRDNLGRNGCGHILVENLALSARDGIARFDPSPKSRATARLSGEGENLVEVEAVCLDNYAERAGIGHVDLLKVDVEGFEMLVFEGAEKLLGKRAIDVIYYEHCPANDRAAGFAEGAPIEFLARWGYVSHEICDDGSLKRFRMGRERVELANLVAFSPAFAQRHSGALARPAKSD